MRTVKVLCFYLPNNDASKVEVELVRLFKDRDGNIVKDRIEPIKKQELPKDKNYTDFNLEKDYSRVVSDDFVLGYRFLLDGKPYTDNTLMTKLNDGKSFNIAIDSKCFFERARRFITLCLRILIQKCP
jgi:hypothetical protein